MKQTVGQTIIRTESNKLKESEKIVQLRAIKRTAKKNYEQALSYNREKIPEKQTAYFKAQQELKNEL